MILNEIMLLSTTTRKQNRNMKNLWTKPGIKKAVKKRDKMHNLIKFQTFNTILKKNTKHVETNYTI